MEKTFRHLMTLAAAALLALPFAACSNEDTPDDGTVAARITAQIASAAGTRTNGTAWDIGDSFGLSTDKSGGG